MSTNRGSRGWQLPPADPIEEADIMEFVFDKRPAMDVIDLVKHDGVWMTAEQARACRRLSK